MAAQAPSFMGFERNGGVVSACFSFVSVESVLMAKRKALDEDVDEAESSKLPKHSLDSDEDDDDAKKYEILDEDDIEGQEDATIEFDGDIQITPFNMKEELEEGHFDKDGNYFLNKDEEEVKDHWLDNIDWVKVKAKEVDRDEEMDSDADVAPIDRISAFKEMLALMQPGETVIRAIKRLGKGLKSATASTRWNRKDKKVATTKPEDAQAEDLRRKQMLELTENADRLLHSGNLVIYEATYEKLGHLIHMSEIKTAEPSGAGDTEPQDMFGDTFDVAAAKAKEQIAANVSQEENKKDDADEMEVMWQFKWKNEDGAEVFGPHSSSQMQKWVDDGYFPDGVWVRKADQQNADFYTSKRIDFELYMS